MGDFFLWLLAGFEGLDLKRGGVLNWNSRTRSARGLKGLLSCTSTAVCNRIRYVSHPPS